MMKKTTFTLIFILTSIINIVAQSVSYKVDNYFNYNDFLPQLDGYLGEKLNLAINGVKERNIDEIVEPFRHQEETWMWQSEFWENGLLPLLFHINTPRMLSCYPK